MLTHQQVVPYLLQHRLLDAACIVNGDLVVSDLSRRNRAFAAIREHEPSYLLKQGAEPDGIGSMAHEAAVYRHLRDLPAHTGLAVYLPRCYAYDPDSNVLVLELVRAAHDLRAYHARLGRFPTAVATQLGHALASLHTATSLEANGLEGASSGIFSAGQPAWILAIDRPDLDILRWMSGANIQLIKAVQSCAELCQRLNELRATWQTRALIHGDIKWDNCLARPSTQDRTTPALILVDWELAQPGDPCWDVGSVFMDYLGCWLFSIPLTGGAPTERFMELARYPLETMHPAIRAFWRAYVQRMHLDPIAAEVWLLRAVAFASARLIQTTLEQSHQTSQLTSASVALLQLSLNVLRRPHEAAAHLLGIGWEERVHP